MLGNTHRIGPYEILSAIGAGGMGEVYRARDTKLNRDVALKVLPEAFALDPERLVRFKREAQVLAALNHPNIAHIYGFEDSGSTHALVLELVEGPTLADRIAKGPIPLDEALPIAKQIAEALEAAHEQGIIHRDLKPANIKVREDGTVKVLDFGLAKALEPASAVSPMLTNSPTITSPAMMTGVGTLLGTAAYMSPEQAKGRPADKRSDVWAFGCVLYEMLTGKRAFEGEDISDTLANVLKTEPDWARLTAMPLHIRLLIKRCLEKERRARISDIAVAQFLVTESIGPSGISAAVPSPALLGTRVAFIIGVTGLLGAILVAGSAWWSISKRVEKPQRVVRLTFEPPPQYPLRELNPTFALSPDGDTLVYVSENTMAAGDVGFNNADGQLMVRSLDARDAVPIRGVIGRQPFFSPDGKWIAYFSRNELQKVSVVGGPSVTVCKTPTGARGGTWGEDGTIVFATNTRGTGLLRVPAIGGEPGVLTALDNARGETNHLFPSFVAGRNAVLFTIVSGGSSPKTEIAVIDLRTREKKILIGGGPPSMYSPSGHLVFASGGTILAAAFDVERLAVRGDAVAIFAGVTSIGGVPTSLTDFTLSSTGALAYLAQESRQLTAGRSLVWVDRQGREEPTGAPSRSYISVRLSPNGTEAAVSISGTEPGEGGGQGDVWIWEFARKTLRRLTFGPRSGIVPIWMPDSRRIIFTSGRDGVNNIYWQAADGTGSVERLTTSPAAQAAHSVSPDGKTLVFQENDLSVDIRRLSLPEAVAKSGHAESVAVIRTPALEAGGEVSPDGRWLAYYSNESGQAQVYVRPFPNVERGRWQVSPEGGTRPAWSPTGHELFYLDLRGNVIALRVQLGATFSSGNPTKVANGRFTTGAAPFRDYDVSRDGQRFLMIKDDAARESDRVRSASFNVVLNWDEELKQRVPVK